MPAGNGVSHLRTVAAGILCGGEPRGSAGFEALKSIGVRSVISVDAARPDFERARTYGMRYVHIPIEYGEIPESRQLQLAKAVVTLPGPVYFHCHRGIHRGPAAAALASVLIGKLDPRAAVEFMRAAGTSADYAGLYRSVKEATPIAPASLALSSITLPEVAHVEGLADTMTRLDRVFGRLERMQKVGWVAMDEHPDLVPQEEADQAAELLCALVDELPRSDWPEEFWDSLAAACKHSDDVSRSIASKNREAAGTAFQALSTSCKRCHAKYRD